MDEQLNLKQKLELLGEPALPDSLTAGELFRRMDSGELTLPEGDLPQPGADTAQRAIPWVKVLRRGVPIAACLALVVLISQRGLWRMGSSGGNFTGNAAAPQAAAAADQAAPAEQYSLEAANDAAAPEPDPGPRAIAIEDDAEEEEAVEDIDDAADADDTAADAGGEVSRLESAENSEPKSAETAKSDEADEPDVGRPDSGVDLNPDSWTPEIGWGEDGEKNIEPPYDIHPFKDQVTEIFEQLYLKDETLIGLTPLYGGYHTDDDSAPTHLTARWPYINDAGQEVTWRLIQCSVNQDVDGNYGLTLISFEEYIWEE